MSAYRGEKGQANKVGVLDSVSCVAWPFLETDRLHGVNVDRQSEWVSPSVTWAHPAYNRIMCRVLYVSLGGGDRG